MRRIFFELYRLVFELLRRFFVLLRRFFFPLVRRIFLEVRRRFELMRRIFFELYRRFELLLRFFVLLRRFLELMRRIFFDERLSFLNDFEQYPLRMPFLPFFQLHLLLRRHDRLVRFLPDFSVWHRDMRRDDMRRDDMRRIFFDERRRRFELIGRLFLALRQ